MTNYLVDFIDSATDAEISQYLTTNQCTVVKTYSKLNKVYLVGSASPPPATAIITSVIDDSALTITPMEVITVIPATHDLVTINTSDEKQWWKLYSGTNIDLSQPTIQYPLHESINVDIYLVDSGIMISHPEFVGQNIELLHSVIENDFSDADGHGTAIASLLTGNTCSINRSPVKIVKLFSESFTTLQSDLLASFDAIVNSVLLTPDRFGVVNLSWSIPRNVYIEQKIQLLIDLGIRVVVSAGNNGIPIEDVTPAAMKDVITVGAYNQDFTPCAFSDFGGSEVTDTAGLVNHGELNIWAPGARIWVAAIDGTYKYAAGTSFAAGIVSAGLAYNSLGLVSGQSTFTYPRYPALPPVSKSGLLVLTDPKYSTSPNLIFSFKNVRIDQIVTPPREITRNFRTGERRFCDLINVLETQSYEFLQPLPNWLTVIDTRLVAAMVPAPADNILEKLTILINIVPLVGDPFVRTINLNIIGPAFDPSIYAADDPLVKVTPAAGWVTGDCSGSNCHGTCLYGQSQTQFCISPSKGHCHCF